MFGNCKGTGKMDEIHLLILCLKFISPKYRCFSDVESMCAFIRRSVNYDGGIGQGPGLESHGGSTFCAVAALALVGRLWDGTVLGGAQLERLKGWLLLKQGQGFHGRTNKPDDSCYAFWIGATLTVSGNGNYGRAFQLSTTNNLPG